MKITYFIGQPGTGKTTKMRGILAQLRQKEEDEFVKEGYVTYHRFAKQKVLVLGRYDEGVFAGTDTWAKTAGPRFRQWILENQERLVDWEVYGEGERLSNNPSLDHMFEHCEVDLVCLIVSEGELARRRAARNNTQNETWMKGMATRIAKLCAKYPHRTEEA
jgi:hypothetical protein